MQGWSFACIEVILTLQAISFEAKIANLVISFCRRFGIMGSEMLTAEILLKNILYEVFLVYVFYRFEKRQRDLFKSQKDAQKELVQLKDVLQKLFSPCINVIEWSGEKSLFQNGAFETLLESFENSSNPLLAFQKSLQINDDISLKDFLQGVKTRSFSDSEAWYLSGSCKVKGQILYFDLTITSILWNQIPSLLIALENVTHKKELSELQLAQQDKDMLIATVSHELRTPLHGVLGLIQIVESKIKEQEALEYLSLCKDNANLLLNLVNSLLDNQQIQHGKIKLFPSKVHIQILIKNVLGLFSFQANQKNIKLSAFIEDDVPSYIITDENRLKQVLINLVSNALKFTFSGSITINVSQQDQNHLRFSVSDTGRGIRRDDLGKIFKMYTKLEDKEGLNKHGVGLGLTISNNIAKLLANQQNGITVESQYGSGSTFSFVVHRALNQVLFFQKTHSLTLIKDYFPTQQQQPSMENLHDFDEFPKPTDLQSKLSFYTSTPHSLHPKDSSFLKISNFHRKKGVSIDHEQTQRSNFTPANTSKMTRSEQRLEKSKGLILVVDDNYFNIMIAKNLIESSGYQVETALSGQETVEKFEDSVHKGPSFVCILMDCQMPLMDGFETTKVLKKIMVTEKIKSVPIIALTASLDKSTVQKCYDSGMVEHLSKPLIKEDLLRVLAKFEGKR